MRLAVIGKIHDGLCAHLNGHLRLFQLLGIVHTVVGNAEVYVDFGFQPFADALGRQARMPDVGRNGNRTLGHAL